MVKVRRKAQKGEAEEGNVRLDSDRITASKGRSSHGAGCRVTVSPQESQESVFLEKGGEWGKFFGRCRGIAIHARRSPERLVIQV
jgi:hypothetical protein